MAVAVAGEDRAEAGAFQLADDYLAMNRINSKMPNRKTDTNNCGPFSSDFIGGNWEWRITREQLDSVPAERIIEITRKYGRAPKKAKTEEKQEK